MFFLADVIRSYLKLYLLDYTVFLLLIRLINYSFLICKHDGVNDGSICENIFAVNMVCNYRTECRI